MPVEIPKRLARQNCAEGRHDWGRTVVTASYGKMWSGYQVCKVCGERRSVGG